MTPALWGGALVGLGAFLLARGLRSPGRPVGNARPGPHWSSESGARGVGLEGRLGLPARRLATSLGLDPARRLRADLALVGRSPEAHAARQLLAGAWLVVLVVALALVLVSAGARLGGGVALIGGVVAGLAGLGLPDLLLRAEAAERRRELAGDLATFLELMVLSLAAGSGVEGALASASEAGEGWTWDRLRLTLREARLTREPSWEALTRLSSEVGVAELAELAAAISLSASSGARLRDSLFARAEALRGRELARARAEAGAASERMTFPVVALAIGFLVLIGYPGLARVLAGF